MPRPNQKIPPTTKRILDIQSLNRCAFPDCTNTLIEPGAGESGPTVTGHVCHIHAVSPGGPRWKSGLTVEELNSSDNLILLCRHHHGVVDTQPKYYTVEMLRNWKREHEARETSGYPAGLNVITEFVNEKIKDETDVLRKSRFFEGFDKVQFTLKLARELLKGALRVGTAAVRSQALAWCARILSSENREKAEEYLKYAKELESCHETTVAEAFLSSQMGGKNEALSALAEIDTPMSRTAAFMIVAHHEGQQSAVDWLKTTGIDAENLDPDGKLVLLKCQLDLSEWKAAREVCDLLTDEDLSEMPILHQLVAITYLLSTVPDKLRSLALVQIPFDTVRFPLDDLESGIEARRVARRHFVEAQKVALLLSIPRAAAIADEYALWLELRDPSESENGRKRLGAKFSDLKPALRFVRLGVQFGVKLDLDAVEREIERQTALKGEITPDAALARFALIFTIDTPEKTLVYIDHYQDELLVLTDREFLQSIQIKMLLKTEQFERAHEVLNSLIEEGVPEAEINRHRLIIAEAKGHDTVEDLKEQFRNTNDLGDLVALVDALEAKNTWDDLCEYGAIHFETTHALPDAELYAVALYNTQKIERLTDFLDSNGFLLSRSRQLKLLRCWTLYYEGKLLEASSKIEELSEWWDNPNCRELRVNIGIFLGDWDSLSSVIAHECENKNDRSAEALIRTAWLAFHLGLPQSQVKELTFAAVEKAEDNAGVLTEAYFLASIAGWENAEAVSNWLQRAVALSGDDGPIRNATIQEVVDQKPKWDRIQSEVLMKLRRGELPMYGAGHVLNKSLINTISYPFYENMAQTDPGRRSPVFAYSGKKQRSYLGPCGKIAMDVSALLTLSSLDILDKVLDAFEEVHISHSTLGWFFVERKKAVFHQPSRIREARQIRDMLAEGALNKLTRDSLLHNDLADQVGQEIAQLITEAETAENEDGLQRIVVCPYPVHRVDSLKDEEADLTKHVKVLSSCTSVVEKLRHKSQITENVKRHACSYLRLHERPWPDQPKVTDGAILYLSNLAATYFHHLGLLEKLKVAGFRPVVSPSVVSEVDQLISYGKTSDKIETAIERIRSALRTGLATGKVKTAPRVSPVKPTMQPDEPTEQSITDHPTNGVLALADQYDAIVVDDRFIGQYDHIDAESTVTPVFSSLDVIDVLVAADSLTNEDRMEYRTILRKAGYILVPVDVEELIHHLASSSIENGEVVETAELKAIRENLQLVRLSGCYLSAEEDNWLSSLFMTFREVLKELWKRDTSNVRIRSNWILSQLDIRGWAQSFERDSAEHIVNAGYEAHVMSLVLLPIEELPELKEIYWDWLENKVLGQIKEESPELYLNLVERFRIHIASMVDECVTESAGNENSPHVTSAIASLALDYAPPSIREALIEDSDFREEHRLPIDATLTFADVSIQLSTLTDTVRRVLSGKSSKEVIDKSLRKWQVRNTNPEGLLPNLVMYGDVERTLPPIFTALSPDKKIRLISFDQAVNDINLPSCASGKWREILSRRALIDEEIYDLNGEFRNTPIAITEAIVSEITAGNSPISTLVPPSRIYFERLVGKYDNSPSIREYAAGNCKSHFDHLSEWRPYEGFLLSLLLSSHASLTDEIDVDRLSYEEMVKAYKYLVTNGDRISQLGAIEVGLRVLPSRPELEESLICLIEQIRDENVEGPASAFKLLSSLFCFVDGELARTRLFSDTPPFYRRLAAMSQAALIHRQLVPSSVDIDGFCDWMTENRRFQHYLQSLADMRQEPRWEPRFAAPSQMKSEFIGRIMNSAVRYGNMDKNSPIHDLLYSESSNSLRKYSDLFYAYLPGPLEGTEKQQDNLPSGFAETIKDQLGSKQTGPSKFAAFVNFGLVFGLNEELSQLAVHALRSANYRLRNVEDRAQLVAELSGLAVVAAATRNSALADAIRIVVRRYRADAGFALTIQETANICFVAAASRSELNAWTEYVGECMTELAFGDLQVDEGLECYAYLIGLCHAVPELRLTCGRADAALLAFNAS